MPNHVEPCTFGVRFHRALDGIIITPLTVATPTFSVLLKPNTHREGELSLGIQSARAVRLCEVFPKGFYPSAEGCRCVSVSSCMALVSF